MSGQHIPDDGLARIVLKLVKDDPALNVEGLNDIHPMYEALIALLRQQLSDKDIVAYFSRSDGKENLKSLLLVDTLMEEYKKTPSYTSGLKTMLLSGKPHNEIVYTAALLIGENKRIQEGKVLQNLGQYDDKFMMRALRKLKPSDVYVKTSDIPALTQNAKIMRHNRNSRTILWLLGAGILSAYISYQVVVNVNAAKAQKALPDSEITIPGPYNPAQH